MNWERHGSDWPNRAASRFVESRPHRWHVQRAGDGPKALLLHGAGASTHSWRDLLPELARDHDVLALDLPGHGFTKAGTKSRSGLAPMSQDVALLLEREDFAPEILVGHSAGALIAAQLALDLDSPRALVAFNGAFGHFKGPAAFLFPLAAKLLAMNPFAAPAFARLAAAPNAAPSLLASTGSRLDARGVDLYGRLISDPAHVDGALAMMSQWEISPLLDRLSRIETPALLIAGARDRAVPPDTSETAARRLPNGRAELVPEHGHLLHEERPDLAAEMIRAFAAAA